jgi:DNA invertase Pin-like site-specific DNA recombinase
MKVGSEPTEWDQICPLAEADHHQHEEALERLAAGESQSSIARTFNVDRATISRLARR